MGFISAEFSRDGKRIVTASADKTARVWDAQTGKQLGEPMKHEAAVRSAKFSPDGKRIVTASEDKTARVWDAPP
jgi:WD40 repeat protein